jgi:hypothetical protein
MPKLLISFVSDAGETTSVEMQTDPPTPATLNDAELALFSPSLADGVALAWGVSAWVAKNSIEIETALQILFGIVAQK